MGRWLRLVYSGALVAALVIEATLEGGLLGDPFPANVASTAVYSLGIFLAYLLAHRLLADRPFARSDPWINTLILVGPGPLWRSECPVWDRFKQWQQLPTG